MADSRPVKIAILALAALFQLSCLGERREPPPEPPASSYSVTTVQLQQADEVTEVRVARVTPEFFALPRYEPLLGRTFIEGDFGEPRAQAVVIMSHELWQDRFHGRTDMVGSTIRLDGRDRTVLGIMPAGFPWPEGVQLWIPQT